VKAMDEIRRRFLLSFRAVALVAGSVLVVTNFAAERYVSAAFVGMAMLTADLGARLARAVRLRLAAGLSTALFTTVLLATVLVGDGISGSAATFFAVMPLFATIAGGTRPGSVALGAVLLTIVILMGLDPRPPPPPPDGTRELVRLVASRAMLTTLVGAMAILLVQGADQLNSELDCARRQAEGAGGAKARLLANCSHDLRTPIHAVQGYTALLAEDAADADRDAELADLDKIEAASRDLLRVIDQVIVLARLEGAPSRPEPRAVDLAAMLRDCAHPDVVTSTDLLPHPPLVDVEALQSLLHHLTQALARLPAARIHVGSPRPGWIRIRGRARFGDLLDGPGSPFEPFRNGALELTLCERLATVLGGRASVEHGGLSFEIPLDRADG